MASTLRQTVSHLRFKRYTTRQERIDVDFISGPIQNRHRCFMGTRFIRAPA